MHFYCGFDQLYCPSEFLRHLLCTSIVCGEKGGSYGSEVIFNEGDTFYMNYFLLGVVWWCGREVVWRRACFGAALT
jgi:hypothetical protein